METLQPPRPHTRATAYARAIVLVSSIFLFPVYVLYCPVAAIAVIFVAVGTAFVAAIYEEYVYAKSFREHAETLQAALDAARGRVSATENEKQTPRAPQGMLADTGPGPTISSEQCVVSLRDEDGIEDADFDTSCLDTTQFITPTEIELLNEKLQSGIVSVVDLYISLRYATEHIAELTTELQQMKRGQAVTDRRMHQLQQETPDLQQELAHASLPINSNLPAAERLEADPSAAVTSKSEESSSDGRSSRTRTTFNFRFPPRGFVHVDAVGQHGKDQPTTTSTPAQEHIAPHDFVAHQPTRRRTSTITNTNTPSTQDREAARIETAVKRRVYEKVELAFNVCRKQGKFGNDKRSTLATRDESGMYIDKVGMDSLRGVEEALKEIRRERRGRKVRQDS